MTYKHDYDKTLYRLITILTKLNDGEELSVKDLAEEFNVSTRTIQRDLNERLISFPIYQENRKWKMSSDFKLEKNRDIEEIITLDILEKMAENSGKLFSKTALKLLSKIKNQDYNPIYTKLNLEDISDKFNNLQLLESAIKSKLVITCEYQLKKILKIKIKPLKIVNYEGFWYLVALDYKDDTLKKYYLKNIDNIQFTKEIYQSDKQIDDLLENSISVWFQKDIEPFEVILKANTYTAKYFQRKPLPTQKINHVHDDGSIEFIITVTHEMEIIPIVKYWSPALEVIEPKWIEDIIIEDFQNFIDKQT